MDPDKATLWAWSPGLGHPDCGSGAPLGFGGTVKGHAWGWAGIEELDLHILLGPKGRWNCPGWAQPL